MTYIVLPAEAPRIRSVEQLGHLGGGPPVVVDALVVLALLVATIVRSSERAVSL